MKRIAHFGRKTPAMSVNRAARPVSMLPDAGVGKSSERIGLTTKSARQLSVRFLVGCSRRNLNMLVADGAEQCKNQSPKRLNLPPVVVP